MTKNDLKTGMIVKTRGGNVYRFYKEVVTEIMSQKFDILTPYDHVGAHLFLKDYINDLTHDDKDYLDIVEVRLIPNWRYLTYEDFKFESLKLLWKREEKKKYTYAQLRELVGEDFEIVEG